jgi:hypothetical protein
MACVPLPAGAAAIRFGRADRQPFPYDFDRRDVSYQPIFLLRISKMKSLQYGIHVKHK